MIYISQQVLKAIIAQAQQGLPCEICGYLAAKDDKIIVHYELTNIDKAADHFSMNPVEQFGVVKDMRQKGIKMRAVYHSHPETPARPSVEDIKLAYDPEISYVIISLAADEPVVKSFRIKAGKVAPEQIKFF